MIKYLYPEYIKNSPNLIKQLKTMVKIWSQHFIKENIQMAIKHLKRCSILLAIRETQIKMTTSYHYTPIRMANIKSKDNTK